jgi:hypothetical protein
MGKDDVDMKEMLDYGHESAKQSKILPLQDVTHLLLEGLRDIWKLDNSTLTIAVIGRPGGCKTIKACLFSNVIMTSDLRRDMCLYDGTPILTEELGGYFGKDKVFASTDMDEIKKHNFVLIYSDEMEKCLSGMDSQKSDVKSFGKNMLTQRHNSQIIIGSMQEFAVAPDIRRKIDILIICPLTATYLPEFLRKQKFLQPYEWWISQLNLSTAFVFIDHNKWKGADGKAIVGYWNMNLASWKEAPDSKGMLLPLSRKPRDCIECPDKSWCREYSDVKRGCSQVPDKEGQANLRKYVPFWSEKVSKNQKGLTTAGTESQSHKDKIPFLQEIAQEILAAYDTDLLNTSSKKLGALINCYYEDKDAAENTDIFSRFNETSFPKDYRYILDHVTAEVTKRIRARQIEKQTKAELSKDVNYEFHFEEGMDFAEFCFQALKPKVEGMEHSKVFLKALLVRDWLLNRGQIETFRKKYTNEERIKQELPEWEGQGLDYPSTGTAFKLIMEYRTHEMGVWFERWFSLTHHGTGDDTAGAGNSGVDFIDPVTGIIYSLKCFFWDKNEKTILGVVENDKADHTKCCSPEWKYALAHHTTFTPAWLNPAWGTKVMEQVIDPSTHEVQILYAKSTYYPVESD